jgi:hypothetical protein
MWKQSNMVQIVREFPFPTGSGKIMPFFVSKPKSIPSEERSTASQKI